MNVDEDNYFKDLPIITLGDGYDLQGILGEDSIDSSIFTDLLSFNKDENNDIDKEIGDIISATEGDGISKNLLVGSNLSSCNTPILSAQCTTAVVESTARNDTSKDSVNFDSLTCTNSSLAAEYESFAQSILTSSFSTDETNDLTCTICSKSFSKQRYLKRHFSRHKYSTVSATLSTKGSTDFTCSVCMKSFPDRRYLNRHLSKHMRRFTCPHCQKSFARKESKLKHIPRCPIMNPTPNSNDPPKPKHTCDKCFQQFTRKENYEQHMWKHKGIQVVCQSCEKTFSSMKSFSAHKKLHYATRTLYFCDHCAAVFSFKSNLKRHLRKYQNAKDIITCNNCNLRVKNQESLNKHRSQSTKHCILCSQSFCLECDLRKHRKVLHPELWFKCKLCEPKLYFTARSEHHLQNHARKAHKMPLTFMNCYEEGWYVKWT